MRFFSKPNQQDVLVVDDDPVFTRILVFYLENAGFGFDTAVNSRSALALLRRVSYRAALVDYKMPGMNGFELCKRIKRNRKHRGMYIILMSGEMEAPSPVPEIFDEFIKKPFDMKMITEKLSEIIFHEGPDNKQGAVIR